MVGTNLTTQHLTMLQGILKDVNPYTLATSAADTAATDIQQWFNELKNWVEEELSTKTPTPTAVPLLPIPSAVRLVSASDVSASAAIDPVFNLPGVVAPTKSS